MDIARIERQRAAVLDDAPILFMLPVIDLPQCRVQFRTVRRRFQSGLQLRFRSGQITCLL